MTNKPGLTIFAICSRVTHIHQSIIFTGLGLLLGRFLTYGKDYMQWYAQNNTMRHNVNGHIANAGNALLPSIGYCDIQESSLEVGNDNSTIIYTYLIGKTEVGRTCLNFWALTKIFAYSNFQTLCFLLL